MLAPFTYAVMSPRIVFGAGRVAELGLELDRLGVGRALLLSTPGHAGLAERVQAQLGAKACGIYAGAAMHTPTDVTADALTFLQISGCDGLVALGGGSTIGLGKALSLRTGLPQVAVPTTYAGSEMTPILGETEGGRKRTQRTPKVLPAAVIYDVELTLSLPPFLSAVSGMNAIAHAVEALYARDANPVVSLMAEEAVAVLGRSLPLVVRDGADHNARSEVQYGAWLCGACLGAVGMGLHHKICHVLGGSFNLPHAETHAVMISHVAAYNEGAAPGALGRVARALGGRDASAALFGLGRSFGTPAGLGELGMPEAGINDAVTQVMQDQYWNPRPPDRDALLGMLRRAWAGAEPQTS